MKPAEFKLGDAGPREGHDGLTDDEIVTLLQTVMVAGHDTTTNSLHMRFRP